MTNFIRYDYTTIKFIVLHKFFNPGNTNEFDVIIYYTINLCLKIY